MERFVMLITDLALIGLGAAMLAASGVLPAQAAYGVACIALGVRAWQ